MSSTSLPSSDYRTLLEGDHGFILALALTVLIVLALSFLTKLYFTWRRYQATGKAIGANAVLISDAWWLSAHVFAFAYLGVRISTLAGMTEGHISSMTSSERDALADRNEAGMILFILALYLSFCSVLCAALAIMPSISKARNVVMRTSIYSAPGAVFIIGLLLATLPQIGCNNLFVFKDTHDLCPSASGRVLPVMIIIILLDIAVAVGWSVFVHHQTYKSSAGRVSPQQSWLVAPFLLRFLTVGANVAYVIFFMRYNARKVPYFSIYYPELLSILASLVATTSVSMNRILGMFNFGGIAYTQEPSARSHNQSALGSNSRSRIPNGATPHSQTGGKWDLSSGDLDGWEDRSVLKTNVGPGAHQASRKGSGDSERYMLQDNAINRKVEVHQVWEDGTGESHNESLEER